MKGADPQIARDVRAEHSLEAMAHLAGRLVGERDREDAIWRHVLGGHQVGDSIGDDTRFAAACACEHKQRATRVHGSHELRIVQFHRRQCLPVPASRRDRL